MPGRPPQTRIGRPGEDPENPGFAEGPSTLVDPKEAVVRRFAADKARAEQDDAGEFDEEDARTRHFKRDFDAHEASTRNSPELVLPLAAREAALDKELKAIQALRGPDRPFEREAPTLMERHRRMQDLLSSEVALSPPAPTVGAPEPAPAPAQESPAEAVPAAEAPEAASSWAPEGLSLRHHWRFLALLALVGVALGAGALLVTVKTGMFGPPAPRLPVQPAVPVSAAPPPVEAVATPPAVTETPPAAETPPAPTELDPLPEADAEELAPEPAVKMAPVKSRAKSIKSSAKPAKRKPVRRPVQRRNTELAPLE